MMKDKYAIWVEILKARYGNLTNQAMLGVRSSRRRMESK